MEAYCMKCKTRREILEPVATFNAVGAPITRGKCPQCGTALFRTGRTEAHANLTPPAPEEKRSGKLVIVESPAKAKTVGRFLGKGYTVRASVGHIRDLLRSQMSVDIEHNFTPQISRSERKKKKLLRNLKNSPKNMLKSI